MAPEPDQNQTDTGTTGIATPEATPTPLGSILDTHATPAEVQEGEAPGGNQQVSLRALQRERERRRKADREVEELRQELDRFDNSRFGFDLDAADQEQQQQQPSSDDPAVDAAVRNYNQSYDNFIKEHGKEAEAKVDAATKRMTREQQQHVLHLVRSHANPVAAIHAYADQLGLLDFRGQPIDQVLASKGKPPEGQFDTSQLAQHVAELNRHGQEVAAAERRTTVAASRTDFVSQYGKAAYDELDRRSIELVRSGHPVAAQFVQAVQTSPDPVSTAAQMLYQLEMWAPEEAPRTASGEANWRSRMPSNFASARSVNGRSGPAFSGPTPLTDIFKR
jgi:hypothetical protein